jgi:acyl-coenzyme A thioesterase PaaI-like protein
MIEPDRLEVLRGRYDRCFGCGRGNAIGLHIDDFVVRDGEVAARFTPRAEFAGFEDTLHGGVVATALDEASAWAAMLTEGVLVFTARIEVRYRSPAIASHDFRLAGRVTERRGRRLVIDASMSDGDDGVVASSTGLFVVAEAHTAELGAVTTR